MKPPAFDYHAPRSTAEAVDLLHDLGPEAKILAGGQSLMPLLNMRLTAPDHLVDVTGIPELHGYHHVDGTLRLGATTRHQELERRPEIARYCPLLAQAAPHIGHPQIRARGTLGGSLAHADPAAELPAVAVALDATMVVRSVRGERRIPAGEFFTFHMSTALADDEILIATEFPVATNRQGSAFLEVAARAGDFALAGAAVVLRLDDDGRVADARIVCLSVAPTPARVPTAEAVLRGRVVDADAVAEVAATVTRQLDPAPHPKASAAYKRRACGVLAGRAVERAWEAARGRAT